MDARGNVMTNPALNRKIAEALEPFETLPILGDELNVIDESLLSPLKAWVAVCNYADGDIPKWLPRDFFNDPECTVMLQERLIEDGFEITILPQEGQGLSIDVENFDCSVECRIIGKPFKEAVCLAFCKVRGIE